MKITYEKHLKNFEFWGGAKELAARLTEEEFDMIEEYYEDIGLLPPSETDVNDFCWFEADFILSELLDKDPEEFWGE